jgi:RimJ/RimL family protein N-acetyltransferase
VALPTALHTERLILRLWRDADRDAFAALNADPAVMEYLGEPLPRASSDLLLERARSVRAWLRRVGYRARGSAEFMGFAGLSRPSFEAHFTPCIEIGWRIGRAYWGQGYAHEAACAALRDGFERLALRDLVSFTALGNRRSRRLMERLGMQRAPHEDFDHPLLPIGHTLCRHVLYRLQLSAASLSAEPACEIRR